MFNKTKQGGGPKTDKGKAVSSPNHKVMAKHAEQSLFDEAIATINLDSDYILRSFKRNLSTN